MGRWSVKDSSGFLRSADGLFTARSKEHTLLPQRASKHGPAMYVQESMFRIKSSPLRKENKVLNVNISTAMTVLDAFVPSKQYAKWPMMHGLMRPTHAKEIITFR
jgi:hypothetical protein